MSSRRHAAAIIAVICAALITMSAGQVPSAAPSPAAAVPSGDVAAAGPVAGDKSAACAAAIQNLARPIGCHHSVLPKR